MQRGAIGVVGAQLVKDILVAQRLMVVVGEGSGHGEPRLGLASQDQNNPGEGRRYGLF